MKKGIKTRKLNRSTDARKQLFRSLTRELAEHGFVVTTEAKAKAVKPIVEKLVTRAKVESTANLRLLLKDTGNLETTWRLFAAGKTFAKRPGGYTRLIKFAPRVGDNAQKVKLEWVEKVVLPIRKVETVKSETKEIAPSVKSEKGKVVKKVTKTKKTTK